MTTIQYFLSGKMIAEAPLPNFSTEAIRKQIATRLQIERYDEYRIVFNNTFVSSSDSEMMSAEIK